MRYPQPKPKTTHPLHFPQQIRPMLEWNTPEKERLKMIELHTKVTLENLVNVKRKLYHSTGLHDSDFITYFETNDIESFHQLMRRLAEIPENVFHTKRGKPIILSTIRTPEEIVERLM